MIGASKILTVSYGTFSCTLEGFDDPLNTMKAIAEYFRDLAADDRYFGAEPPTPDTAMLSRIAERQVHRHVEAKIEDNGVVLRASEFAGTPPAPAPQPAPAMVPPAASGLLADESVAAKLQRIRAAVARSAAAAPAPVIEDAVFAEDDEADIVVARAPEPQAAPAPVAAPEPEPAADAPIADLRATWEDIDAATEAAEAVEVAAAAEEVRQVFETAVVPEPLAEAEPDHVDIAAEAALPDLSAAGLPEEIEVDAAEDHALIAGLAAEPAPLAEPEAEVALDGDDTVSDILATLIDRTPDEAEAAPAERVAEAETLEAEDFGADGFAPEEFDGDDVTPYAETPAVTEDEDKDARAAALEAAPAPAEAQATMADEDEDFGTPAAASFSDAAADATLEPFDDDIPAEAVAGDTWPADPEAPAVAPDVADKLRRARARVIKVRRPEPLLLTEAAPRATAAAEDETTRRGENDGRSILEAAPKADEDVTRLLRQTNTEMEGAESKRRMSTLAHLKAAVAATVAELRTPSPSAETGEPSRLERYRADLARVVRTKRNENDPVTGRPAPLVLVSEQRIDRPSNTDASPTRIIPRRISSNGNLALSQQNDISLVGTDAENILASARSFAEFAESLGAHDLPDLLEAAAAYTACIEGREHFSRPHLMRHVSAVAQDSSAVREDSMRSFGQLLRQGKIAKVKRGQFTITDSSYYLAEARRMVR